MPKSELARRNMVDCQIRPADVTDPRIISAMGSVLRELFVPEDKRSTAYGEGHIEIAPHRYLLDPLTFCVLLKAAEIKSEEVVLIIGGGDGYSGAVISRLADAVLSLESDAVLAANAAGQLDSLGVDTIAMLTGPLAAGYSKQAPYDVIFVNGAVACNISTLTGQLRDGGRLVCVEYEGSVGRVILYRRDGNSVAGRPVRDLGAPILPGFEKTPSFQFD